MSQVRRAVTLATRQRKVLRRKTLDCLAGGDRARRSDNWYAWFGVTPNPQGYRMAPDRRLLIPLIPYATKTATPKTWNPGDLTLVGGTYYSDPDNAPSGDDDYREDVYGGPPSQFWLPGKSSNGAGTSGDPYQYSQLAGATAAGDITGIQPGFEALAATSSGDTPAFNPGVSGTAMSRVVWVGQKKPLSMGNPLTDATRSQIGHDGAAEANWCPTIGVDDVDYNTFDSIVLDSADGKFVMDGGAISLHLGTGIRLYRLWVQAETLASPTTLSNYCAIWNRITTDLIVEDCTFKGFRFTGSTSTNISAIILYSAFNYRIANNRFEDCNQALYSKGNEAGAGRNYGIFCKNRVHSCNRGMRLQETSDTVGHRTEISQNLLTTILEHAYTIRSVAGGAQNDNIRLCNNTAVMTGTDSHGLTTGDSPMSGANFEFFENITQLPADGANFFDLSSSSQAMLRVRNNAWYRPSGSNVFQMYGVTQGTMANWQSHLQGNGQPANAREESSQIVNPDLHATTFRPQSGATLTMGTAEGYGGAGGEIGYGSATIGPR